MPTTHPAPDAAQLANTIMLARLLMGESEPAAGRASPGMSPLAVAICGIALTTALGVMGWFLGDLTGEMKDNRRTIAKLQQELALTQQEQARLKSDLAALQSLLMGKLHLPP